jgi:hypothetical protein
MVYLGETPSEIDTQLLSNITRLLEIIESNSSLNVYQFMFDVIFYALIVIMLTVISTNMILIWRNSNKPPENSRISDGKYYEAPPLIFTDQTDMLSDSLSNYP